MIVRQSREIICKVGGDFEVVVSAVCDEWKKKWN
jgi:hypothetical protein